MYKYSIPLIALLALAACDSGDGVRLSRSVEIESDVAPSRGLKVISALQCPAEQDVLVRQGSASVDGNTCTYTGPRGAEVKLHLVSLQGTTTEAVLKSFQDQLGTEIRDGKADENASPPSADTQSRSSTDEKVTVRLPGMRVDTQGDRANVRLPGMSIEADGDKANIRIGGLVIRADDSTGTITSNGTLNMSAHSNDNGDGNFTVQTQTSKAIRASMIHAVAKPVRGDWRVVGYEARGPAGGPIVVATFRTRDRDEDAIADAVRELVNLNVGD